VTFSTWLTTALALGVVHAALGVAVVAVTRVTGTLHLAIGPVVVAAGLAGSAAAALGASAPLALAVAAVAGVVGSIALTPVLAGSDDPTVRLIGLLVAGGVLELGTARLLGGAARRPPPLLGDDPVVAALAVGGPLVAVLAVALTRSRWGRRLRLVGGSPTAAERIGVDPRRTVVVTLAVAGVVAAVAAALIAPVGALGVGDGLGLTLRGTAAAVVLGGRGAGRAAAGGALIGAVEAAALALPSASAPDLVVAAVVVAVLLAAPSTRGWERTW
jgi:branched-chain amino acid transport system permease protein